MPKTLIAANPTFQKDVDTNNGFLEVSEFFCDTIQGENFIGWPATFLRLQHCTLNCIFCDTNEVWRKGNPYSFEELFTLMEEFDLIRKFKEGQHWIFTGGSPMRQQFSLIQFIKSFIEKYGFKPYIEIENEAVVRPLESMIQLVDCWNNSPKLSNSNNSYNARYKPEVLLKLSQLKNSWFKFVISQKSDWEEIEKDFIEKDLILKSQIVLMPCGATRDELESNREITLQIAIEHNVRYTTREHIVLWDKKTGV